MNTFLEQRILWLVLTVFILGSCSTAPGSDLKRRELQENAEQTLQTAKYTDSTLTPVLESALGYAVYPSIGKGAIGVGGAYGRGILYENGRATGYTDLSQATIGLQLGGQKYTEILVFNHADALRKFKLGDLNFSSQATAVALQSGTGANAKFKDGVAVFTMDEAGLMFEASIGGQKFDYQPF